MVVDRLARGFVSRGHEVVVLAPKPRGGDPADDDGLPYPVVRHSRFCSTRWFVTSRGRWLARLHKLRPFDVVHCHSVHPTGYVAAQCGAVRDAPLVISSHGGDIDDVSPLYRKPGLARPYRQALNRADALVAVSGFVEGRLREWCERETRIERIPHGVDLEGYAAAVARPSGLPSAIQPGKYFLFLGRIVKRKGVDVLLEAFREAVADERIVLVLAGDGSAFEQIRAQVAGSLMEQRVVFCRWVDGDAKTWLLQNAVCNVMPSRHSEAFGLTALESFAAGRPVIASDVPGLRDLVVDGQNGLLVEPDSVNALTAALREMLGRPERLEQFGQKARRTAEGFSWDRAVERHLELFESLTPGRGSHI
jgi:glycosyltransferase involved in cell wall biosynthesis